MHRPEQDELAEMVVNASLDALEEELVRRGSESLGALVWLAKLARETAKDRPCIDDASLGLPRTLGRFRLESLLGTGGYGAVFSAFDAQLTRNVALKLAWPGVLVDPASSQRFADEPRAMAAVKHCGIVEVYDAGEIDMVGFISMELVDGPTLAEWSKNQPSVSPTMAAKIIRAAAQAIEVAHRRGIVHRDLKPTNVLMRPTLNDDDLPVEPVVTDFGLARQPHLSSRSMMTATGAVVGTDHYMSPEQAAGRNKDVRAPSDIFSLGVMLYELVSGVRPFDGESSDQIRERIREADPTPLHVLRGGIPRDLDTIILKCMEKSPELRYVTAQELADDLSRFLKHEPIHARPITRWRRGWKFAQRKPILVTLAAVVTLSSLAIAAVVGAWIDDRAKAADQIETAQSAAAVSDAIERQHQYVSNIQHAAAALRRGGCRELDELLEACRSIAKGPLRCGLEWDLLWSQAHDVDKSIEAHAGNVHAVRFSCAGDVLVSAGEDGRVVLWDTTSWTKRSEWNAGVGEVNAVEISADGSLVAIGGDDGRIVVQRTADLSVVFDRSIIDGRIFGLAWLGQDLQLAAGGEGPVVTIIDPIGGTQRCTEALTIPAIDTTQPVRRAREISSLVYLPGERAVAVAATPYSYHLIDSSTLGVLRSWREPEGADTIACASGGTEYIATSRLFEANPAAGNLARITNGHDGSEVARVMIPHDIESLTFSRDARVLAGGFRNGSVWTWGMADILAGRNPKGRCFLAHRGRAVAVDVSPDNEWLASGGWDGRINVWHARPWGDNIDVRLHERPEMTRFSPCGRWFAVVNASRGDVEHGWRYLMFDAQSGSLLWKKTTKKSPPGFFSLVFSPSGDEALFLNAEGALCGHDPRTGAVTKVYHPPDDGLIHDVYYSPDAKLLLLRPVPSGGRVGPPKSTPQETHEVVFLDRQTDAVIQSETCRPIHCSGLYRTVLGTLWVQMGDDRKIVLSATPSSAPVLTLSGPSEHASVMAVSGNGRYLAMATYAGIVFSWDLKNPGNARKYIGHEATVHQLCFSPDNQTILSTSLDGTVRFWSTATGTELLQRGTLDERVVGASLHPSGNLLVLTIEHAGQYGWQIHRLGPNRDSSPRTFDLTLAD